VVLGCCQVERCETDKGAWSRVLVRSGRPAYPQPRAGAPALQIIRARAVFPGPFSAVSNHFRPRRHLFTASAYRQIRTEHYARWRD
jgi:hypothetical protein